jgi:hypothetical protein
MRADSRAGEDAEGAVPGEDKKRAAHRALVDSVLNAEGRASPERRARAFSNDGLLPPPLQALVGKVATRPGCTDDELFELVICAAVGQSARLYDAGLAALAQAIVDGQERSGSPRTPTLAASNRAACSYWFWRRAGNRSASPVRQLQHLILLDVGVVADLLGRPAQVTDADFAAARAAVEC